MRLASGQLGGMGPWNVGALPLSLSACSRPVALSDAVGEHKRRMNAQPLSALNLQSQDKFTTQETVVRAVASAALAVCCTVIWPPAWAHAAALCYQHQEALATISAPLHVPLAPPLLNEQTILSDSSDPLCPTAAPASTSLPAEAEEVSNEYIVAEAWQVVNERFLDARLHKWSPDSWLRKREEVLKRSIPSRMAAYNIIKNMLSELNDPYTRFITPAELKQLSKYDMTGIGLSLGEVGAEDTDSSLRVVGIVLGSPAQLAGVKQGDELLSVNGVDVHGKSAFEASSLIQGVKGTLVSIEIRHEPCKDTQMLSVERKQSVQTPVYYRLEHRAGDLLGYIRLKEFNAVAKRDMVTAMDKLSAAGATSFLLDLRDNPGGLVQAGIEVAKVFLDEGDTVVYTVAKDPEMQKGIFAKSPPVTRAPLMIFVNERTASASEIVAAALHDNCRAVLVGHKTFGKGLIQSVFELSDGSGVILTVGKYATPHHQEIDENGIVPDFRDLPDLVDVKNKIQSCLKP